MISNKVAEDIALLFNKVNDEYHHQIRSHIKTQHIENIKLLKKQIDAFDDDAKNSNIVGDYLAKINDKFSEIEDIANRLDDQFMLFIMGSGKNGKSTLINALIGQEIAEVNFLPKTWKIDIYNNSKDGEGGNVTIRYKNGNSHISTRKEAEAIFSEEELKQKESQKKINNAVRAYKEGHSIEETEQFKAQQNKYELYRSNISEALWNVEGSEILKDYSLVDTPGLKQELEGDMVISSAKDYYHKADGVIWLLPADKISGSTDRTEMEKLLKAYGKRHDNMIAVIGKIDKVGDKVEDVIKNAKKLYGDIMSDFIPVTAKKAIEAKKDLEACQAGTDEYNDALRRFELSGIPHLIKHLKQTLYNRRSEIQMESKQVAINELYGEVYAMVEELKSVISEANKKREALERSWNNTSNNLKNNTSKNLSVYCKRTVDNIYNRVSADEDMLWDMEDTRRNAHIQEIINPSSIENGLKRIIKENSEELQKNYVNHSKMSMFKEFPALDISTLKASKNNGNLVKIGNMGGLTNEEGATFVAGGALAAGAAIVLGPIGLALGALAFTGFGKSVVKWFTKTFSDSIASKVKSKVSYNLNEVNDDVIRQYDRALNEAKEKLNKIRNGSYSLLYGKYNSANEYIKEFDKMIDYLKIKCEPLTLKELLVNGRINSETR
ncbi:dynamin family protein [Selenomonas ruminantium]|uniref:Dynamin family protein n=1 Tax=Selenomonas ruminantium TaxID=971 RepID=A0A1H3VQ66_SELRU|nr:dynamin family protein [Selenomonas ruminantium]SDZ76965.1 Dynamin family protein [Selenomonas ruminantium]